MSGCLSPQTLYLNIVGFYFMNKQMKLCPFLCLRPLEAASCGPAQVVSASSFGGLLEPKLQQMQAGHL